jgi:hypothetical protein
MTCIATDRLLQTLRVHVPGVTPEMLTLEIFNVLDEFFRRTSAWRYVNQIQLSEDLLEYDLNVPTDATVVRVMAVTHNGVPVPAAESDTGTSVDFEMSIGSLAPDLVYLDGDAQYNYDLSDIKPSNVFSYAIYRPDVIAVTQPPDVEKRKYPLVAVLALTVARSCLEAECDSWSVEDWAWDMYFQDWLDGVLGRLYGMPMKPWSNQTHAVYHARRFRNAMASRKQEAMRGFVYDMPRWRFPRVGM